MNDRKGVQVPGGGGGACTRTLQNSTKIVFLGWAKKLRVSKTPQKNSRSPTILLFSYHTLNPGDAPDRDLIVEKSFNSRIFANIMFIVCHLKFLLQAKREEQIRN